MYARLLSRSAFPIRWSRSRRFSSFERHPQGTSSKPSAANGRIGSPTINLPGGAPLRFLATRSAADGYLLELVSSEIEQTKQKAQAQTSNVKDSPLGPFIMKDKLGTEDVVLSRTLGSEKIEIACMLEKQYPEDEDEEEQQKLQHAHEEDRQFVSVLHMNVSLSRADSRVELDCSFVQGASEVMIEDVLFHEPDSSSSSSTDGPEPYGGPDFEELDEKLQEAFLQLLKVRGINVKVARYMMDYMSDKGQREYVGWLHRLNRFLTC